MAPFVVGCIAQIPIGVLNKFLVEALDLYNELALGNEDGLVIVEADDNYEGAYKWSDQASVPPLDESFRPHITTSIEDAAGRYPGGPYRAVLNQQSLADESAVLVAREPGGEVTDTARVTFELTLVVLVALEVGTIGLSEIRRIGESQGGVYGRPTQEPKKGEPAPLKRLGG
ncbi:hypothetical protein PG993_014778 [Apiospora rasikravindrae]|uniref:Uncharacterized protein n=1 Tax=Apiospora rasikravindrae TaxID=990691 RepID=A0ABR1RNP6_9PEZI